MPTERRTISKAQLAMLHVAKAQLGLDDDTYRDVLQAQGGVLSARELDEAGFERVLGHFTSCGFVVTGRRFQRAPTNGTHPTPKQLALIRAQWTRLGWEDTERQRAFCQRFLKTPWPQTRRAASQLIEAQKAMIERGYSDRAER